MFSKPLGMRKHGKGGHTVNSSHFTGKTSKKGLGVFNPDRKQKLTAKQKRAKRGTHVNKYAHLKSK